jgi:hypothetical protein
VILDTASKSILREKFKQCAWDFDFLINKNSFQNDWKYLTPVLAHVDYGTDENDLKLFQNLSDKMHVWHRAYFIRNIRSKRYCQSWSSGV